MAAYVISVKREMRDRVQADWSTQLQGVPELQITGSANPFRIQVEASDAAIEEVRSRLGDVCHVEPVIRHQKVFKS